MKITKLFIPNTSKPCPWPPWVERRVSRGASTEKRCGARPDKDLAQDVHRQPQRRLC